MEAGLVLSAVISLLMLLQFMKCHRLVFILIWKRWSFSWVSHRVLNFFIIIQRTQIGSFHIVVLQIYAKKFAKIFFPRAQPLFCLLNVFVSCRSRRRRCRCRGFLKLPIQKCALFFLLLVVSRTIRTQSVELLLTLTKKYVFHVKYVKRKVDLLRYIGIAR